MYILLFSKNLPNLGKFREEKAEVISKEKVTLDLLDDLYLPEPHLPANQPTVNVPKVKVRGLSVTCCAESQILHLPINP